MINNFIIFKNGARQLRLSSQVLKKFRRYEQIGNRKEAGGVLLGQIYKDFDEIIDISTPNESDRRGLFFFNRAFKPAQVVIDKKWKESKGKLVYLGEWHTHSEKNPFPSHTDKMMIQKMYSTTKMEIDYLYLVIVGLEDTFFVGRQEASGLTIFERIP